MSSGVAVIQESILGFLLVGLSWMRLLFRGNNKQESVLLKPWIHKASHYCSSCGTFIVYPDTVKPNKEKEQYLDRF